MTRGKLSNLHQSSSQISRCLSACPISFIQIHSDNLTNDERVAACIECRWEAMKSARTKKLINNSNRKIGKIIENLSSIFQSAPRCIKLGLTNGRRDDIDFRLSLSLAHCWLAHGSPSATVNKHSWKRKNIQFIFSWRDFFRRNNVAAGELAVFIYFQVCTECLRDDSRLFTDIAMFPSIIWAWVHRKIASLPSVNLAHDESETVYMKLFFKSLIHISQQPQPQRPRQQQQKSLSASSHLVRLVISATRE